MGMGIVSDAQFNSELKDSSTEIPSVKPESVDAIIVDINKGRGEGNVQVPNSLRKIIGETSITDGRQESIELASRFGISSSSASAYSNGSTSTASYDKKPNENHLLKVKASISKSARNKLREALRNITPEKLAEAKVKDLSGIAKDMSAIIKDMEPDTPKTESGEKGPQFVFFAPQVVKETSFEVINSKD